MASGSDALAPGRRAVGLVWLPAKLNWHSLSQPHPSTQPLTLQPPAPSTPRAPPNTISYSPSLPSFHHGCRWLHNRRRCVLCSHHLSLRMRSGPPISRLLTLHILCLCSNSPSAPTNIMGGRTAAPASLRRVHPRGRRPLHRHPGARDDALCAAGHCADRRRPRADVRPRGEGRLPCVRRARVRAPGDEALQGPQIHIRPRVQA